MKLTSRRKIASVVGVAAVAAISASVLAMTPASAGNAFSIEASTTNLQASAGTCVVVTYQPRTATGEISQQPDTLTVTLTENPEGADQDVDFCSLGATVPTEAPSYVNGNDAPPAGTGATRTYTAGPSVTGNFASSGGNPDIANDSTDSGTAGLCGTDCANTNPNGVDRARYNYIPGNGPIRVGVVGLRDGGATIRAFFDDKSNTNPVTGYKAGDYTQESTETGAPVVSFKITPGGQPGSQAAADAVSTIDIQPANGLGAPNAPQSFNAILKNNQGDTVSGVTPRAEVGTTGANPTASPSCGQSNNAGVSACTFTGSNPGSDQVTVWVQKAGTGQTAGIDANEVSKSTTLTTTKPPVPSSEARYIDLTPKSSVVTAGQSATYTATITDVNGAPARLVSVLFTKSGPGSFPGGANSVAATTDDTGRAFVTISTAKTETGTFTLIGTINTQGTQCGQAAGAGNGSSASTPAGRCTDSAVSSLSAASPTPSPTGTRSPTPTPTSTGRAGLSVRTSTPDIQPNESGILDATGQAGQPVELQCYSRPNTTYFTARSATLTAGGATQFRILPGTNTRCYVRYAGDDRTASNSVVINVHTTLSLSAVRNSGVRNYTFQGRNLPRRSGQLITLYRIDNNGNEIRTANLKTDASGIYRVPRHFTGAGTFTFVVRTSQTLTNAPGVSNPFRITIR